MQNEKLIVISGCSGGGKSSLLSELKQNGFTVIPEVGREIVKEQLTMQGNLTPWENPQGFCELAIEKSVANYYRAKIMAMTSNDNLIFLDRCFLDNVGYFQTLSIPEADKYNHLINHLRFYPTVFMTPPWSAIFTEDKERKHTYEEAVSEYKRLLKFYSRSGYNLVEIPRISVHERFLFVISNINLK